jgi:anti-anti-sigma factor
VTTSTSGHRGLLEISSVTVGFRRVLSLEGEVDVATVPALRAALKEARESGERDIWIDLTNVGFLDSSGVSALVEADRAFSREHRRFAVICPPGPVRRVLELTGLDKELALFHTRADAQRLS